MGRGTGGTPPCRSEDAGGDEAEGAKGCGATQRSAGLGVWKGDGERRISGKKRGSKRKLDQTPTRLAELRGASKQLPVDVDEGAKRSWERADAVGTGGDGAERGIGTVRSRAGRALGRVCEAGAATRWGRNERERLGLKAPSGEPELPPRQSAGIGGKSSSRRQSTAANSSFDGVFQTCPNSPS